MRLRRIAAQTATMVHYWLITAVLWVRCLFSTPRKQAGWWLRSLLASGLSLGKAIRCCLAFSAIFLNCLLSPPKSPPLSLLLRFLLLPVLSPVFVRRVLWRLKARQMNLHSSTLFNFTVCSIPPHPPSPLLMRPMQISPLYLKGSSIR